MDVLGWRGLMYKAVKCPWLVVLAMPQVLSESLFNVFFTHYITAMHF